MSLINSLSQKNVEVTQLQRPIRAVQKKTTAPSVVSNLFVGQQTDHSEYIRAKMDAMVSIDALLGDKRAAESSLIGTQALATDSTSPDGKASSAALKNRVDTMYLNQRDKKIRHNNDASVKKENKADQVQEAVEVALANVSKSAPLLSAPERGRIAVKVQKAPAKISIRV